jgi:hypothetical protein
VSPVRFAPLAGNPDYHPPEVLAGIQEGGSALDLSEWKYRKPIKLIRPGAQRIELDLDVLSHAQAGFGDLRLVSASKQLPYILEPTSISRSLTPAVSAASDKKDPRLSRWIIKLPRAAAPRYDLSLVASRLLAADHSEATLTAEEKLKTSWGEGRCPGTGGVVFWGMPAPVVAVLLIIISRLLP